MSFTPFRFLRPELRRRGSTAEGGEEGTINVARSKVREKEREEEEKKEQTK